jgi:hypothetical protein
MIWISLYWITHPKFSVDLHPPCVQVGTDLHNCGDVECGFRQLGSTPVCFWIRYGSGCPLSRPRLAPRRYTSQGSAQPTNVFTVQLANTRLECSLHYEVQSVYMAVEYAMQKHSFFSTERTRQG